MEWRKALNVNVPAWLLENQARLQSSRYTSDDTKMQLVLECAEKNVNELGGAPLAAAVFHKDGELLAVGVDAPGLGGHEMSNALLLASNLVGTVNFRSSHDYEMFSLAPPCLICLGNIYSEKLSRFVCAITHVELLQMLSLPNTPMPDEKWEELLTARGIAVEVGLGQQVALRILRDFGERIERN